MIEIFYPKEMRQAIEELRAKDDLNEKVFVQLWKSMIAPFIVGVLLFISCITSMPKWYLLLGTCLFTIIACVYTLRRTINIFVMPYSFGSSVEGQIEKIRYGKAVDPQFIDNPSSLKGWRFVYSFYNGDSKQIRHEFDVVLKEHMSDIIPEVGDPIEIYLHPNKEKFHVPFLPLHFKGFCLSKQKIHEKIRR